MSRIELGAFVLDELLGRGGMGEVWAGHHARHGVEVAIKVIAAQHMEKTRYREALRRESRAIARLHHPGVVRILDEGIIDHEVADATGGALVPGSPYLVMERLSRSLRADGALDWPEVRRVVLSLLDALAHIHACGVLHLDIKPSNVLRSGERVVLTDFGVARLASSDEEHTIAGTPAYMPLELLERRLDALGPWTDLYMVGALAVALATGSPPFGRRRSQVALREAMLAGPPRLEDAANPMPGPFQTWLERVLSPQPEQRFRFAAHAAKALLEISATPRRVACTRPTHAALDTLSVLESMPVLEESPAALSSPRARPQPPTPWWPVTWPLDWRSTRPHAGSWSMLTETAPEIFPLRSYPMVGRERERDVLWHATGEALSRNGSQLVIVRGDRGMGKTRLLQWWRERLHELGVAQAQWLDHEPLAAPGQALRGMVRRMVRWDSGDVAASEVRLRSRLASWEGDVALLTQLLDAGSAALPSLSSRARHANLLSAWTCLLDGRGQVLRALAADDCQWSLDTLRCVQLLLETELERPTLIVLAARNAVSDPEVARLLADLEARSETCVLNLGPLPPDAQVRLSSLLELEPRTARRVESLAAGSPSVLIEILNDAIRRGELYASAEGYAISTEREHDSVWRERIEDALRRLPVGAGPVLECAALLGQELRPAEWSALCARECVGEQELLQAAIHLDVLRERDEGWVFSHHALRETLRECIPPGRLAELHGFVAEVLQAHSPRGRHPRLAMHLWEAGERLRAVPMLLEAVWDEHNRGDNRDALLSLDVLKTYLDALELEARHPWRVEALALESTLNLFLSRMESLEGCLARLSEVCDVHPRWEALLGYVRGAQMHESGRHDEACVCFEHVLALCEASRGAPWEARQAGRALLGLADAVLEPGSYEASVDYGRAAVEAFERAGDDTGVAVALLRLAHSFLSRGELEEASAYLDRAEAVMPSSALRHKGDLMMFQGELARARGAYHDALRWYQQAHDANASMGYVVATALMLVNMGLTWTALNELSLALELFERARLRFVKLGSPVRAALVQACMLKGLAGVGAWGRVERCLEEVRRQGAALADPDVLDSVESAAQLARTSCRDDLADQLVALAGELRSVSVVEAPDLGHGGGGDVAHAGR